MRQQLSLTLQFVALLWLSLMLNTGQLLATNLLLYADKSTSNSHFEDACSATSSIQITTSGTSATITWEAVAGVSTFDVEVESEQSTPAFKVEQRTSGTSLQVSGLTAGGLYKVRVRSRCGDKPETIEFFTAGSTSNPGNTGNPGTPSGNCAATAQVSVNSTSTTATITWDAVSGVSSYEVEVESEQTTPAFHVEQQVSGTSFQVSGLTAGGLYKVKVKSRCGDKPETIEFFTAGSTSNPGNTGNPGTTSGNCAATAQVSINSAGTTATITWDAVSGVSSYEVEVESEQTTPAFHVEQQVSGTSFQVSGLTAGGLYKVKVKSRCGDKPETIEFFTAGSTSNPGNTGNPGTTSGNCAATAQISVNSNGTTATITWDAVSGVSSYEVEVESEQTTPALHVEQQVSGTSFQVSGLTAGGLYKVKVKSRCGDKPETIEFFTAGSTSNPGNTGNPGTTSGNCAATAQINVNSTGTTATITWDAVSGVSSYEVEVESEQTTPAFHVEQQVGGTSFQVSGLTTGGLYKVKVKSSCGDKPETVIFFTAGSGVTTGNGNTPVSGNCAVTERIFVETLTDTSVLVTWSPVAGVNYYELEVEREVSNIEQKIQILTSDTSWLVTGLVQGALYKVEVHSQCSSGGEANSVSVFFIAGRRGQVVSQSAPDSCYQVTGLQANPGDPMTLIRWNSVAGAAYYEVEIEAEQTNIPWQVKEFTVDTFLNIAGLIGGANYQVKVKAKCLGGDNGLPASIRFIHPNGLVGSPSTSQLERRSGEINDLVFSPNPARSNVQVHVNSQLVQNAQIRITDLMGKVHYQAAQTVPAGPTNWMIPVDRLITGMYQITLQVGNRISVGKLSIIQ